MSAGGSHEIGIVLYPGAQLAAIHGLTDLLGVAGRIAADSAGERASRLRVSHWSPSGRGVACVYQSAPAARPRPGILVIPPTLSDLPDSETCGTIADWLLTQHSQGVGLVTICSGVFLVAGTGLLDGRVVSTHRSCVQALADSFPKVAADVEVRMIEHPGVLTAGGFLAWIDVALILVERLLGGEVRTETARFALAGERAAEADRAAAFPPRREHGDMAVRKAQEFVHLRDGQDVPLAAMAAAAGLERRTFLRRFVSATGTTPIRYCRAVRVARASELLAAGDMPLKQIAESLGFADVGSFARAFRRAYGVPPGAFRRLNGGPSARHVASGTPAGQDA